MQQRVAHAAEVAATRLPFALRAGAVQRLPSQLHAHAVAGGTLVPDASQADILPRLDALVSELPHYADTMRSHGAELAALSDLRSAAVARDEQQREASPLLHRLRRAVHGVSPHAPGPRLPDAYLGVPPMPAAPEPPRGVYLHGDVGCGKSLLVDMLFDCARHIVPGAAARVHYHAFMAGVYAMIHRYDAMPDAQREQQAMFHPLDAVVSKQLSRHSNSNYNDDGADYIMPGGLLCFDEFQVNDVADARLMHGIFDRLMSAGTIVCFTSNRPPAALNRSQLRDADFSPFLDLLHDRCDLVHVKSGIDYRARMADNSAASTTTTQRRMYFTPDDEQGLIGAWAAATHGADWDDVSRVELPVAHGRRLVVPRASAHGHAVQMSCAQLIEANIGVADYRALCAYTSTIILTDVLPVFDNDTRNYARRFITLIDVCYEAKVRIAMRMHAPQLDDMFSQVDVTRSVADAMEGLQFESEVGKQGIGADNRQISTSSHLFSGEDEMFAFRRAVSRLKEMQTEDFVRRSVFH